MAICLMDRWQALKTIHQLIDKKTGIQSNITFSKHRIEGKSCLALKYWQLLMHSSGVKNSSFLYKIIIFRKTSYYKFNFQSNRGNSSIFLQNEIFSLLSPVVRLIYTEYKIFLKFILYEHNSCTGLTSDMENDICIKFLANELQIPSSSLFKEITHNYERLFGQQFCLTFGFLGKDFIINTFFSYLRHKYNFRLKISKSRYYNKLLKLLIISRIIITGNHLLF